MSLVLVRNGAGDFTKSGIFKEDPGYVRLNYGPQMTPTIPVSETYKCSYMAKEDFPDVIELRVERFRGSSIFPVGLKCCLSPDKSEAEGSLTGTEGRPCGHGARDVG